MPAVAVVALNGVMARGSLPEAEPITEGLRLFHALRTNYNVALLPDHVDHLVVTKWLLWQGVTPDQYGYLYLRRGIQALEEERLERVGFLKGQGLPIEVVVDASPVVIRGALKLGYTGLLFAQPRYARPEWRPDTERGAREWALIEEETDRQRTLGT